MSRMRIYGTTPPTQNTQLHVALGSRATAAKQARAATVRTRRTGHTSGLVSAFLMYARQVFMAVPPRPATVWRASMSTAFFIFSSDFSTFAAGCGTATSVGNRSVGVSSVTSLQFHVCVRTHTQRPRKGVVRQ